MSVDVAKYNALAKLARSVYEKGAKGWALNLSDLLDCNYKKERQ